MNFSGPAQRSRIFAKTAAWLLHEPDAKPKNTVAEVFWDV